MKRVQLVLAAISLMLAFVLLPVARVMAIDYDRLIEDSIFTDSSTMSASEIDSFLNSFSNSCISTHKQFKAPEPIGYTPGGGFKFGSNVSAGRVIYDAAQVYDINPQVLLVTIQKEQGYVSGPGTYDCTNPLSSSAKKGYTQVMGYGCPDGGSTYSYSGVNLYTIGSTTVTSISGTCVNTKEKAGFSQQVIRAAWLLKFGEERSKGHTDWNVQLTSFPHSGNVWDNSDDPDTCYSGPMTEGYRKHCDFDSSATFYDGYTTIDGSAVHMDTGATAALYWYTPHKHGNLNFFNFFSDWFGNPAGTYKAQNYSRCCHFSALPGTTKSINLRFKNIGTTDWYDEIGSNDPDAPFAARPVMLMTSHPIERSSKFAAPEWSGTTKPARNFTKVYDSNGSTLSSNQHAVAPGQIASYTFDVVVPANTSPGKYREYFQPVVFKKASLFNDPRMYIDITVETPRYTGQILGRDATVAIHPGHYGSSYIRVKNTGNVSWYDNDSIGSAPSSTLPTMLVTAESLLHYHPFGYLWGSNRNVPARTFDSVYNSDWSLSSNQHVVAPGQWAIFTIDFYVPLAARDQLRRDYFVVVGREKISGHWKITQYSGTQTYLQVKVD